QPVSLGEASLIQGERDNASGKSASLPESSRLPGRTATGVDPRPCPMTELRPAFTPIVEKTRIVRQVRNLTPYHVSLYLDRTQIANLPPCYGPLMITTPTTEFDLEGVASLLKPGGQTQVQVKIIPATAGNGWDIVPDSDTSVSNNAN